MGKKNIYFLWGSDSYLIDREVAGIHTRTTRERGEEAEVIYLNADELNAYELLEAIQFSPLFSLQRILVIRNPWWLGKSEKRGGKFAEIEQVLADYMRQDFPDQILVLTASEHRIANKLVKMLDNEATVIACKPLSSQQLAEWVTGEFASRGLNAEKAAINMMAKSGQDMYYLQNLIEKTALMVKGRSVVTADIEDELESKIEVKVFRLSDALLKRDPIASLKTYNQLLAQGEHPILFLYIIVRQFMALAKVKYYSEKSYSNRHIAEQTGLKEFMVNKMLDNCRRFSWDELQRLFQTFLYTDNKFKSSSLDDKILMETLIVEICGREKNKNLPGDRFMTTY